MPEMCTSVFGYLFYKTCMFRRRTRQHTSVGPRYYIARRRIDDMPKAAAGRREFEDLATDGFDVERQHAITKPDDRRPGTRGQNDCSGFDRTHICLHAIYPATLN